MLRSALALFVCFTAVPAGAQDSPRLFAGAVFGVSALSADARAVASGSGIATSLYDPKNGPAVNVFGGVHLHQYFSVQANWMWNRNDLTLISSFAGSQGSGFFEQRRQSHQQAFVLDGLVYFRPMDSRIRPYLGTGLSVVRFSSADADSLSNGLTPPTGSIVSTRPGLRSHVGIDLSISRRLAFRYSFSETISGNPISGSLTPMGQRGLMNFQNLFGFVGRF